MTRRLSYLGLLALVLFQTAWAVNDDDYLGYPRDSTVKIYINWDSFEEQGIPSSWKRPFTDAVINAYTRWRMVGSMDFDPRFWGYTTRANPDSDEIIVSMNEKHADSYRLASRFGKPAKIVFHRNAGATNTPWNFTPYRAESGHYDMQAILMHELGHAFGLEHNTNGSDMSVMGGYTHRARFGPYSEDIADIQAQYRREDDGHVEVKRSRDSGASWETYSTNLSSLNAKTTNALAAVRDTDRSIFFYTVPGKAPAWIVGNYTASSFDTGKWWVYGGERSAYGMAGTGWDDEYMMAWVDDTDSHRVKLVYSNNGGDSFSWRGLPRSLQSYATPALYKADDNIWVLAYTKNDYEDRDQNGRIAARVSRDDGRSWGDEQVLNDFYRAENGVTITGEGTEDIRIGFSWARKTSQGAPNNYLKRTIRAHLSGSTLVYDGMIYESEPTRTNPYFAVNRNRMLQAWRETNFLTSVNTRFSEFGEPYWDNYVRAIETSPVTPAIGAYYDYGFAFLYHVVD